MNSISMSFCPRDLQTLLRAHEIISQLGAEGLDAAIQLARSALAVEKSRRQYLVEMLPIDVVYAFPGTADTFALECADGQRFQLNSRTLPLLWQILSVEQEQGVQATRLIHHDGQREWIYWL